MVFMKNIYDGHTSDYIRLREKMLNDPKNSELNTFIMLLGSIKNRKILDLGCGFGLHAKKYSKLGAKILGLDISKKEIKYAKEQNIKNAEFRVQDIETPFITKERYDIITCSLVLDYVQDLEKFFKQCNTLLKTGGILLFSIPNPLLYQERNMVGKIEILGRKIIIGDYFTQRKIRRNFSKKFSVEHYHRTVQNYVQAFLKNNFVLTDYIEPQSRKENSWHSKLPTFLVYKLKKK